MKNLIQRSIVGLVMLLFVAVTIFLGSRAMLALTLVLSLMGFWEINRVLTILDMKAPATLTSFFGVLVLLSFFIREPKLVLGATGVLLITLGIFTVTHERIHVKNAIGAVFSILYIFVPFGMLLDFPSAIYIYLVVLAAWGTDTFAYVFGMLFGKHKLIPKVSPKKSIEGAVGGTVGCMVISIWLLHSLGIDNLILWATLIMIGSVLGQFGDLFASKIKRECGLKDYGSIFIGHGGVLDRFDSMLFVIPYLYTISAWFLL